MQLRVTGKNIDIGDALREQVSERLGVAMGKYFNGGWSGQVTVEREGVGFRTECRIHLDSGIDLHSRGVGGDAYVSFDQAAERIEKRLRRYNSRLKDHHAEHGADESQAATSYVIAAPDEDEAGEAGVVDDNPIVIAESQTALRKMTVGMAVMAMDLAEAPVVLFRNVANGRMNVVYRRHDGNIGWIDPAESDEKEARG
ncbi:ribosome hibernation-promoting factor, HPF/YfiA family [Microbaculum sp. FT89]|uniref:ribosome hibernation-promoting factor, HPF/YfiA family n=1 Tax=Microbaculum sp. FT89 TaxID=3447298 RepID=UPI003F52F5C2